MACSSFASTPKPNAKRVKLSHMSTSEQMKAMKEEIRINIHSLRDQLDAKECELLAEVDRLGALQVSEKKQMQQEIKNLKKQSSFQSTHNRLSAVRDVVRSTIEDMNRRMDQFQEIQSSWQTEESYFDSLCSLSNVANIDSVYQSISVPKWSILIGGKPSQLSSPTSLAIQQDTDNVFVSDKNGERIQVYSSLGEHIRLIDKFEGRVDGLCVSCDLLYVNTAFKGFFAIEIDSLTRRAVRNMSDNTKLFTMQNCDNTSKLSFFAFLSSKQISSFAAAKSYTNFNATQYYKINNNISRKIRVTPVSMHVHGTSLYLLVSESDNLIYEFNSEDCKYIRCFCSSSLLCSPKCVCVDGRGNILVAGSEGNSTKLLCLSPDGDVIHELLIPYEKCIGIAVNSKFDVAILCNGSTHGLISL